MVHWGSILFVLCLEDRFVGKWFWACITLRQKSTYTMLCCCCRVLSLNYWLCVCVCVCEWVLMVCVLFLPSISFLLSFVEFPVWATTASMSQGLIPLSFAKNGAYLRKLDLLGGSWGSWGSWGAAIWKDGFWFSGDVLLWYFQALKKEIGCAAVFFFPSVSGFFWFLLGFLLLRWKKKLWSSELLEIIT